MGKKWWLVAVFLLTSSGFLMGEELDPPQVVAKKDHGRWSFWQVVSHPAAWFRTHPTVQLLQGHGHSYLLSSRGPLAPTDGTVAVVSRRGRDFHSHLWGHWDTGEMDLSGENIGQVRFITGPDVITYGQQSLVGVVEFTPETPSAIDDFYLIQTLVGTNHHRQALVRVGGYATDRISVMGSYERWFTRGSEGGQETRGVDDGVAVHRFALAADWEPTTYLRLSTHVQGLEGDVESPALATLFPGQYRTELFSGGGGIYLDWKKKITGRLYMGLSHQDQSLPRQDAFYLGLYGRLPRFVDRRLYMRGQVATKDFQPLILGGSTKITWGGSHRIYEHIALADRRIERDIGYLSLTQRRVFFDRLAVQGVMGMERSTGLTSRISGGGEVEWEVIEKTHFLKAYGYRHYRRPYLAALAGNFLNSSGSTFLQGNRGLHPEGVTGYGFEYRLARPFTARVAPYYHQYDDRIFPGPVGSSFVYRHQGRFHIYGVELAMGHWITEELHLEGTYVYAHLARRGEVVSRPPQHRGAFTATYVAGSENFFRGWSVGLRLRVRDRMEVTDPLTGLTRRIDSHVGLDFRLSYGVHGFHKRVEFFLHVQDILTGDHLEWTPSVVNRSNRPFAVDRLVWGGIRISL